MISSLVENESRVLPEMRKKGVAPRSKYMCAYIHLVRTCCPRSARLSTVDWLSSTVARAVFEIFGADIINVRELDFLNSKIPNFKILNSTIQIPNGCFLKTTNLLKTYKKYIFFVK